MPGEKLSNLTMSHFCSVTRCGARESSTQLSTSFVDNREGIVLHANLFAMRGRLRRFFLASTPRRRYTARLFSQALQHAEQS